MPGAAGLAQRELYETYGFTTHDVREWMRSRGLEPTTTGYLPLQHVEAYARTFFGHGLRPKSPEPRVAPGAGSSVHSRVAGEPASCPAEDASRPAPEPTGVQAGGTGLTAGSAAQEAVPAVESGMERARAAIEVVAGMVPTQPLPEYTRRWGITSAEWQEAMDAGAKDEMQARTHALEVLTDKQGQAMAYAQTLMIQPDKLNWVRVDWIWF